MNDVPETAIPSLLIKFDGEITAHQLAAFKSAWQAAVATVSERIADAVAAERERCQALIRDLAASWRDSAIKAPDPDVAAEFEYVASSVDAAADLLDGA